MLMNLTHLHPPETLMFVESCEEFSIYRTRSGDDVYLHHGTARVLVEYDELDLSTLWSEFQVKYGYLNYFRHDTQQKFLATLKGLTYDTEVIDDIGFCADCATPEHEDDLNFVNSHHGHVCERCEDYYSRCDACEEYHRDLTGTLDDNDICEGCLSHNFSWCSECDGYYHRDDAGDHDHQSSCGCESPAQRFTLRNDGDDPLDNDTRVTVRLPAGVISDVGLGAIAREIRDHAASLLGEYEPAKFRALSYELAQLGNLWQTKEGNYTKRLSRLAYKTHEVKVTPDLMSTIGTIARNHSMEVDFDIEVTRDLNLSAEEFYHEDSCWWQSYSSSRCALKTNGGFGLRTFDGDRVTGRAWVMPLRLADDVHLTPTFDTLTADAYVVFNGYGCLSDYTPARLLSHMLGVTYRKITFECSPMYVNNSAGYLLAAEEIAERYTDGRISLCVSQHADLYTTEKEMAHA